MAAPSTSTARPRLAFPIAERMSVDIHSIADQAMDRLESGAHLEGTFLSLAAEVQQGTKDTTLSELFYDYLRYHQDQPPSLKSFPGADTQRTLDPKSLAERCTQLAGRYQSPFLTGVLAAMAARTRTRLQVSTVLQPGDASERSNAGGSSTRLHLHISVAAVGGGSDRPAVRITLPAFPTTQSSSPTTVLPSAPNDSANKTSPMRGTSRTRPLEDGAGDVAVQGGSTHGGPAPQVDNVNHIPAKRPRLAPPPPTPCELEARQKAATDWRLSFFHDSPFETCDANERYRQLLRSTSLAPLYLEYAVRPSEAKGMDAVEWLVYARRVYPDTPLETLLDQGVAVFQPAWIHKQLLESLLLFDEFVVRLPPPMEKLLFFDVPSVYWPKAAPISDDAPPWALVPPKGTPPARAPGLPKIIHSKDPHVKAAIEAMSAIKEVPLATEGERVLITQEMRADIGESYDWEGVTGRPTFMRIL